MYIPIGLVLLFVILFLLLRYEVTKRLMNEIGWFLMGTAFAVVAALAYGVQ